MCGCSAGCGREIDARPNARRGMVDSRPRSSRHPSQRHRPRPGPARRPGPSPSGLPERCASVTRSSELPVVGSYTSTDDWRPVALLPPTASPRPSESADSVKPERPTTRLPTRVQVLLACSYRSASAPTMLPGEPPATSTWPSVKVVVAKFVRPASRFAACVQDDAAITVGAVASDPTSKMDAKIGRSFMIGALLAPALPTLRLGRLPRVSLRPDPAPTSSSSLCYSCAATAGSAGEVRRIAGARSNAAWSSWGRSRLGKVVVQPASRHLTRSSAIALAVSAMIGTDAGRRRERRGWRRRRRARASACPSGLRRTAPPPPPNRLDGQPPSPRSPPRLAEAEW